MSRLLIPRKSKRGRLTFLFLIFLFIQLLAWAPNLIGLRAFAHSQPGDALLFREGEILFSRGETEKALWRFKRLMTDFPDSPLANEAKFRMGVCYTLLKRHKEAIRVFNELFSTFLSPARMVQVFTLLGDNHLELNDRLSALHWYSKGILIPKQPSDELRRKIRSVIDTLDTEEELTRIESLYRGAYGGGYAKLKMAQMAKLIGYDHLAIKIMAELEKEYRGMDYLAQAKDLSDSVSPSVKSRYTIGVILPLSGIHQPFGESALQAIQLAIKEVNAKRKNSLIALIIRDSKGSPAEAEKAVQELAAKEKAVAIIGPLLSVTSDRAVKKARQLKVPLLILSPKELLSDMGEFVFQNSLTPSEQVQALSAFAIRELQLRTFAVFHPNSPYGIHFKNLFSQEVLRMGGKVFGSVVYQENQTDFGQEIKGFFKMETIQKEESGRKKEKEFKQGLSVEGLFIPDIHDQAGLIISQMAFYNVKGVTFFGNNAWNGQSLLSIAGKSAEGAVFVDAFFKQNPSPAVVHFVQEFRKAYQREPGTLEAISYDGARFLGEILLARSITSPLQMREALRQFQNYQGVSGLKGFGGNGKAIRNLFVLRVNQGKFEQVSP